MQFLSEKSEDRLVADELQMRSVMFDELSMKQQCCVCVCVCAHLVYAVCSAEMHPYTNNVMAYMFVCESGRVAGRMTNLITLVLTLSITDDVARTVIKTTAVKIILN